MAKVQTILNLEIPAGKAQPAPPLGPMLWANGVNIGQFTKEFNEKTADYMKKFAPTDVKIKCKLTIFVDRTFQIEIWAPITSGLIKWKFNLQKGSGEPNRKKVASITWDQVKAIAEGKMPDLNCFTLASAMKMVAGTARSMGITVTGEFPKDI